MLIFRCYGKAFGLILLVQLYGCSVMTNFSILSAGSYREKEMQIRTLIEEDIKDLVELYGHLNPGDPVPDEDLMQSIWEKTRKSSLIQYIGLTIESQLVSCCQKVVVPNFSRSGQPYCLIENVVTHTDHRNRGYGKKLLKYTLSLAWDEGCYKVMLMSGRKEESVMQFYRDAGFSSDEKRAFVVRREHE